MSPTDWFDGIPVSSVIDITVITVVIYAILLWLRRTRRAALILTGILIVAVSYLLALWFDLVLTTAVLRGFFAVFLIAVVIIFQEELRYFFERVAQWSLRPRLPGRRSKRRLGGDDVQMLTRTVGDLAADRVGALIVVRGRDLIARHLRGGDKLSGRPSEAILKSIFDSHSAGHDGAVIVDRDRIESFGCHLPLSSSFEQLRGLGTRHAAALGLAERTDALCVVVSEERGAISVARHGKLTQVADAEQVRDVVQRLYDEIAPVRGSTRWRDALMRNWRQKVIAVGIAAGLWFGLVHGSVTVYRSFRVPVEVSQVPPDLVVASVDPASVLVTLSGARRAFLFLKPERLLMAAKAWDLKAGANDLPISSADLTFPENLVLERMDPGRVTVRALQRSAEEEVNP